MLHRLKQYLKLKSLLSIEFQANPANHYFDNPITSSRELYQDDTLITAIPSNYLELNQLTQISPTHLFWTGKYIPFNPNEPPSNS